MFDYDPRDRDEDTRDIEMPWVELAHRSGSDRERNDIRDQRKEPGGGVREEATERDKHRGAEEGEQSAQVTRTKADNREVVSPDLPPLQLLNRRLP
jgi:hypothetical protein